MIEKGIVFRVAYKRQLRIGWFRSVRSASENRLKFCLFACPSAARHDFVQVRAEVLKGKTEA